MKNRYLLPIIVGTALFAGLALASLRAQQLSPTGAGTFHRAGRMMFARLALARLHLTADQKRAGLAALRGHQPAIKPLVDNLVKERNALRALSKAPSVDEAAIRAQSARVAGIEADLAVQRAYLMHDLRAVATPEQLQQIDAMAADGEARRAEIIQRVSDWIADS